MEDCLSVNVADIAVNRPLHVGDETPDVGLILSVGLAVAVAFALVDAARAHERVRARETNFHCDVRLVVPVAQAEILLFPVQAPAVVIAAVADAVSREDITFKCKATSFRNLSTVNVFNSICFCDLLYEPQCVCASFFCALPVLQKQEKF